MIAMSVGASRRRVRPDASKIAPFGKPGSRIRARWSFPLGEHPLWIWAPHRVARNRVADLLASVNATFRRLGPVRPRPCGVATPRALVRTLVPCAAALRYAVCEGPALPLNLSGPAVDRTPGIVHHRSALRPLLHPLDAINAPLRHAVREHPRPDRSRLVRDVAGVPMPRAADLIPWPSTGGSGDTVDFWPIAVWEFV